MGYLAPPVGLASTPYKVWAPTISGASCSDNGVLWTCPEDVSEFNYFEFMCTSVSGVTSVTVQYSLDGSTWNNVTGGDLFLIPYTVNNVTPFATLNATVATSAGYARIKCQSIRVLAGSASAGAYAVTLKMAASIV